MTADLLELPFDQYQRYRLVADILNEVRPKGRPLTILDVGGRTALLRQFLPDDLVTAVDLEASEEPGLVLGDGSCLPFQDGSFDVVAGFDTLEHVPPALRTPFVDECARVASGWVVLIGPYASKRVNEAEERLVDFLSEKLKIEHRYLNEHRTNGLPSLGRVEKTLHKHGLQTTQIGQGNLDRWLALMCLELYLDTDPFLRPIAQRFFRFYNETLYSSDHGGDMYRHALVGAKGEAALPKRTASERESVAPAGTTQAVLSLARELLALDSERDVWQPEFQRLQGIIGDLEEDLQGHKSRLADREADLVGHRQSLEERDQELSSARKAYDQQLAAREETESQLRQVLSDVRHDLQGHRDALAQRDKELDACTRLQEAQRLEFEATERELREQLEAHATGRQEILEELAALQSNQVELQDALERTRAVLESTQAALESRAAELTFLKGSLRSRIDNFKRVLRGRNAEPYLPPRQDPKA